MVEEFPLTSRWPKKPKTCGPATYDDIDDDALHKTSFLIEHGCLSNRPYYKSFVSLSFMLFVEDTGPSSTSHIECVILRAPWLKFCLFRLNDAVEDSCHLTSDLRSSQELIKQSIARVNKAAVVA